MSPCPGPPPSTDAAATQCRHPVRPDAPQIHQHHPPRPLRRARAPPGVVALHRRSHDRHAHTPGRSLSPTRHCVPLLSQAPVVRAPRGQEQHLPPSSASPPRSASGDASPSHARLGSLRHSTQQATEPPTLAHRLPKFPPLHLRDSQPRGRSGFARRSQAVASTPSRRIPLHRTRSPIDAALSSSARSPRRAPPDAPAPSVTVTGSTPSSSTARPAASLPESGLRPLHRQPLHRRPRVSPWATAVSPSPTAGTRPPRSRLAAASLCRTTSAAHTSGIAGSGSRGVSPRSQRKQTLRAQQLARRLITPPARLVRDDTSWPSWLQRIMLRVWAQLGVNAVTLACLVMPRRRHLPATPAIGLGNRFHAKECLVVVVGLYVVCAPSVAPPTPY